MLRNSLRVPDRIVKVILVWIGAALLSLYALGLLWRHVPGTVMVGLLLSIWIGGMAANIVMELQREARQTNSTERAEEGDDDTDPDHNQRDA